MIKACIRTTGELTERQCYRLTLEQVPNVVLIHQYPFSEAFKTMCKIECDVLFAVDADMLPLPGAVDALLEGIKGYDTVQGVTDCFILGNRIAGIRAYTGEALKKMRHLGEGMRPESQSIKTAKLRQRLISFVTCKHDYDQSLEDYYRKGAQHGVKHRKHEALIRSRADGSKQWRAILEGFEYGKQFGTYQPDSRLWQE